MNEWMNQSINQSINQSFIHSFIQSINQSINQSVHQSIIIRTDQWRCADADRCRWRHGRWPGRRRCHAPVRYWPASHARTSVSHSSLASSPVAGVTCGRACACRRTTRATWRRYKTCWCDQRLPVTCLARQPLHLPSATGSRRRMSSTAAPETGSVPSQHA